MAMTEVVNQSKGLLHDCIKCAYWQGRGQRDVGRPLAPSLCPNTERPVRLPCILHGTSFLSLPLPLPFTLHTIKSPVMAPLRFRWNHWLL